MKIRTLSMVIVSVFFVLLLGTEVQAAGLPAPTMIAPAAGTYTTQQSPTITGVAPASTRIAVYIDEVFNGYARTVSEANGVQSFAYTPFLPLQPGYHAVKARAQDLTAGTQSDVSLSHAFLVERKLPEPTVIGKVVNTESSLHRPWIVGLAPSMSQVDIWIDGVHAGVVTANVHESGVGDFAFKPNYDLYYGSHAITATARITRADGTARVSATSAAKKIVVSAPVTPTYAAATSPVLEVQDEVTEETTEEEAIIEEVTEEEATEELTEEVVEEEVTEEETTDEDTETSIDVQSEPTDDFEFVEDGDIGGDIEEAEEESTDEAEEEVADEEASDSEEAEAVDEDKDEEEKGDEDDEDKDDESSGALSFVGWALLIIVAIIVVSRMRRGGKGDDGSSEISFGPPTDSSDKSDSGQSQLDINADSENKNIEVIKNKKSKKD